MSGQKAVTPDAEALARSVQAIKTPGLPPVHLWNPPFSGDMDMQIRRDGTWVHEGGVIRREALVRLFASILKKEGDRYFLVTPVEKVGITVEDAPFVAIDMEAEGPDQALTFETNVGDRVTAGPDNPIRVASGTSEGEPVPYVEVRAGLEARIDRKSFYRMVDLAEHRDGWFGVSSGGAFFPLIASAALEG